MPIPASRRAKSENVPVIKVWKRRGDSSHDSSVSTVVTGDRTAARLISRTTPLRGVRQGPSRARDSDNQIRRPVSVNRPRVWLIDMRNGLFIESAATHVRNDSDYCKPVIILTTRVLALEPLSDGILNGPVAAGHAFVDDCNQWRMRTVLRRKIT